MTSVFQRTTQSYRQGAATLPRQYYTSSDILAEEHERMFAQMWHCVGRASDLAGPGNFVVREVAGESLILLRDQSGILRAHFNVCRHRGTRICSAASGKFSGSIQCPYHAWTYALDGRLLGAPHMAEVEHFDKSEYPLHAAAIAEWEGFVFVNVARDAQPFAEWFAPMLQRFSRYDLHSLSVGHRVKYDVHANWKLVFQNYSECLHCPMIHPELSAVLPYQSGANDLTEGPFLGGYMELNPSAQSATLSGRACGLPVSASLTEQDRGRAYYYSLMPNMLLSIHPDYVNYYMIRPVSADHTVVESEWLFNPASAASSSFNPDDAIGFWDVTNRQDWEIVAASQRGITSRRYEPGPYSPRESIPAAWDREYLRLLRGV